MHLNSPSVRWAHPAVYRELVKTALHQIWQLALSECTAVMLKGPVNAWGMNEDERGVPRKEKVGLQPGTPAPFLRICWKTAKETTQSPALF